MEHVPISKSRISITRNSIIWGDINYGLVDQGVEVFPLSVAWILKSSICPEVDPYESRLGHHSSTGPLGRGDE
jgi:hypothetical protein